MTTEYRDANGKLLRTDHGTKPAELKQRASKATTPAPAPAAKADATAPANKEK